MSALIYIKSHDIAIVVFLISTPENFEAIFLFQSPNLMEDSPMAFVQLPL
jgi:hypothetical protein